MDSILDKAIFVFGSNEAGRHGAGAAKFARDKMGAINGQGKGLQGQSYAIPTKDVNLNTLPIERVIEYIDIFKEYANAHPELIFQITKIGCGLAGFKDEDIRPWFFPLPSNCHLPGVWSWNIEMRVILAGGRDYYDQELMFKHLHSLDFLNGTDYEVVSGRAPGADRLGEVWASTNGLKVQPFPAKWDKYKKVAGPIRNQRMSWYGTHLIAFPTAKSRGTYDMIRKATADGLQVTVFKIGD